MAQNIIEQLNDIARESLDMMGTFYASLNQAMIELG